VECENKGRRKKDSRTSKQATQTTYKLKVVLAIPRTSHHPKQTTEGEDLLAARCSKRREDDEDDEDDLLIPWSSGRRTDRPSREAAEKNENWIKVLLGRKRIEGGKRIESIERIPNRIRLNAVWLTSGFEKKEDREECEETDVVPVGKGVSGGNDVCSCERREGGRINQLLTSPLGRRTGCSFVRSVSGQAIWDAERLLIPPSDILVETTAAARDLEGESQLSSSGCSPAAAGGSSHHIEENESRKPS
jgi:hypothetical protein